MTSQYRALPTSTESVTALWRSVRSTRKVDPHIFAHGITVVDGAFHIAGALLFHFRSPFPSIYQF